MPIVSIRDLAHDMKAVLSRVEEDDETLLVTRNGKPVVAIVPVDQADAERYIVQSAPETIAARKRAESARASRPSYSLDEVAEQLGIDRGEADGGPDKEEFGLGEVERPILALLTNVFSGELAGSVWESVGSRFTQVASSMLESAESEGTIDLSSGTDREAQEERLKSVYAQVFASAFSEVLADAMAKRVKGFSVGMNVGDRDDDLFGLALADEALNATSRYVEALNDTIIMTGGLHGAAITVDAYETAAMTGINMIGRRKTVETGYGKIEPPSLQLGFEGFTKP
ncbi:MAG TPA: type II toxin-antitoxin system Phd/YefM family antitoxin [Solirubrobacteraceae bacterium]|jgi:prevent-host-death family protein|nr:type II toxin-antitoxin system Phd/YefM family antitoxin [Solirubrobacteraceae bacterium]